ncbi:hypothetical protein BC940DRAFT_124182 [Gongronella butleri]|nr:hypothetical protein BC940DRAFT_124182 [Gongronella butleri]
MLLLKQNKLPARDLFVIERHLVRWSSQSPRIRPDWHVLDLCRTDLYGHLLGIFAHAGVLDKANASQWLDFLVDVDRAYLHTPYHSFYHAADIVFMLYYMLVELDGLAALTAADLPCLFVAALCHDVGHPGYSNSYQVNAQTNLAKRYDNTSVLENYSVDIALGLLEKHRLALLSGTGDDWKNDLKQLILSTDMKYHEEVHGLAEQLSGCDIGVTGLSSVQRHQLCRVFLHAADLSNTVRPWPIAKHWSDLIVQEFFRQGDAERHAGLPISPGMDRQQSNQAAISLCFGDAVIQPYFRALAAILPKAVQFTETLATNRVQWLAIQENDPNTLSSSAMTAPPPPPPPFPFHDAPSPPHYPVDHERHVHVELDAFETPSWVENAIPPSPTSPASLLVTTPTPSSSTSTVSTITTPTTASSSSSIPSKPSISSSSSNSCLFSMETRASTPPPLPLPLDNTLAAFYKRRVSVPSTMLLLDRQKTQLARHHPCRIVKPHRHPPRSLHHRRQHHPHHPHHHHHHRRRRHPSPCQSVGLGNTITSNSASNSATTTNPLILSDWTQPL